VRSLTGIDLANRLRMRSKPETASPPPVDALRGELERLGLARADAGALAERLARLCRDLSEREYRALLQGVMLGQRAARQSVRAPELQRMLEDFATEVQKLDEGLRVIAAYLSRLREQTALSPARTLH
jgi:hypothetical protein